MEYQKIINLLDNTPNKLSKIRTRILVEINDKLRGTYNICNQIKFENARIMSNLFDYSDAGIHVKRNITVQNTGTAATLNNRNTKVIFKNCAPFTNCISEINNTQIDNTKDIDVVMSMYNLIEYSDNYSKTSGNI